MKRLFSSNLPAWFCCLFLAHASHAALFAPSDITDSVTRGLRVLRKGTVNYEDHRACFTCHHQTLPMLAQATALKHGFKIDDALFRQQTRITHDGFKNRKEKLRAGKGIGGQSMTVGYALWALHLAEWPSDETTDAMVDYLLATQRESGRFYTNKTRPPLEDSPAASAVIAAYYLQQFARGEQKAAARTSVAKALRWLSAYQPTRQEDLNARLWGLHLLGAKETSIEKARQAVLESQREDGGWAQLPDMESDAYATGQALWMLQETGFPTSDPAYQRGAAYLLRTQLNDGSWFVKTRSRAFQTQFESGFPHGRDQFISICGASWAVAALAPTAASEIR